MSTMLILFLCGLVFVPLIVGTAVTPKLYADSLVQGFLNYLVGFSVVLSLYTLLFYFFLSREGSFWILSAWFWPVLAFFSVLSLFRVYAVRGSLAWKRDRDPQGSGRWILYLSLALILFELVRGFWMKSFSYRDDRTYIAMINDILHTGVLNGKQYLTGAYYTGLGLPYYGQAGYKFALSSWYAFEAWLSQAAGLHPLLLCRRLFPVFFPVLYYMVMWVLGCSIFAERKKRYWFLLLTVFLNQLWNLPPQQQILQVWPSWGKNLTMAVYVPMVMILYHRYLEQAGRKRAVLILILMIMVLAGCATSAMGVFLLPVELGLMAILMAHRRRRFRILPETAVMMAPAAALLLVYIVYF